MKNPVLIITGLSGSGRSHAVGVLEDLGYFVVNNLPPKLILPLLDMTTKNASSVEKIAVVIDVRSREYFTDLTEVLRSMHALNTKYKIMFFEASDSELIRRFEHVRRPHPFQNGTTTLLKSIQLERGFLTDLRNVADYQIDTTDLTIHDLSRTIVKILEGKISELKIYVMSFGFKHGVPIDAEFMVDVRFLPNPFWVEALKDKTGRDPEVANYVLSNPSAVKFLDSFTQTTTQIFSEFVYENKPQLTIAFGCTGGQHRSVAMAIEYEKRLKKSGYSVNLAHRDS
ncbi:MAG: RNase adapter RapZ [Candidatus Ancillula trichonymphae]|jgi:UPF0042 nucleotide-binding protein|nr:RNase adapter RapZ [Candidatus Ancillula trichonymphae]